MLGSSKTYNTPDKLTPTWLANLILWPSPPESVFVERSKVRYPSPTESINPNLPSISLIIRPVTKSFFT